MSQEFMKKIGICGTSYQIRTVLENHFSSQSRAKIIQYKTKMNSIKKGSSAIEDFVQMVQCLAFQLGDAGCLVSEEDQILAICNGLDGDYDFIVAIV